MSSTKRSRSASSSSPAKRTASSKRSVSAARSSRGQRARVFDMVAAARRVTQAFTDFYTLAGHGPEHRNDAAVAELATHMSDDFQCIFFWGTRTATRDKWVEFTKEMLPGMPVDAKAHNEETENEVVLSTAEHCVLRVKATLHMLGSKLTNYGTLVFVRDESAPAGVRLVHYHESKVDSESDMKID